MAKLSHIVIKESGIKPPKCNFYLSLNIRNDKSIKFCVNNHSTSSCHCNSYINVTCTFIVMVGCLYICTITMFYIYYKVH